MAQRWFHCKNCGKDCIFEWVWKDHGLFSGGHTEWHCTVCGSCNYDTAREH